MQKNSELVKSVENRFINQFNRRPEIVSLAPGRINIIGEHTDYNGGLAMPAAINRHICTAISRSKDNNISILSMNYDKAIKIPLDAGFEGDSNWSKLISSVIHTLQAEFGVNGGADIVVGGDIPIGCGLSSSTALVVSITAGLCRLFGVDLSGKDLAHLCQRIENFGLGLAIGLLDQYSIVLSKEKHAMMIDFQNRAITHIPLSLDGCSWVVINSSVTRELASSAYRDRVRECREGLEIIKAEYSINSFRDMDVYMLRSFDDKSVQYRRLLHFIDENKRVEVMKNHLEECNYIEVGEILQASHDSLKDLYEVSCDEIDFIIKKSADYSGWYGGRIVGGGFGGCSIHLIDSDRIQGFSNYISELYTKEYDIVADVIDVKLSSGSYVYNV